ncbi:unnamed protein product [Linum tenue]|uniref:Uncharacterized protein n=1 Tax=Linum tenue TaxID=586396 RepID=A0AAV0GYA5_9ROSI|nr:unnamed protein product [Linum tenue]
MVDSSPWPHSRTMPPPLSMKFGSQKLSLGNKATQRGAKRPGTKPGTK